MCENYKETKKLSRPFNGVLSVLYAQHNHNE